MLACIADKLMLTVTKTARNKDNNRRADECIMARPILGIVGRVNKPSAPCDLATLNGHHFRVRSKPPATFLLTAEAAKSGTLPPHHALRSCHKLIFLVDDNAVLIRGVAEDCRTPGDRPDRRSRDRGRLVSQTEFFSPLREFVYKILYWCIVYVLYMRVSKMSTVKARETSKISVGRAKVRANGGTC